VLFIINFDTISFTKGQMSAMVVFGGSRCRGASVRSRFTGDNYVIAASFPIPAAAASAAVPDQV